MDRKHWNLLVIAAARGRPVTPVQLQKVLFILGRELPGEVGGEFYDFKPYNYGPFDAAVYADAESLSSEGLVNINRPQRWNEYAATPLGMEKAEALRKDLPDRVVAYLDRLVGWAQGLTFQGLVRAIYARYPETRAKSIFEDSQA